MNSLLMNSLLAIPPTFPVRRALRMLPESVR
jgi:hypothetical protein